MATVSNHEAINDFGFDSDKRISDLRVAPQRESYFDDDDYSRVSSSEDEEEVDEDEEEEDEEEPEHEEEAPETEESDQEFKLVEKTQEELEEEFYEAQTILINAYIKAKALLKYERKRNAYFQDRIYRTSVRKGIIVESELVDEAELAKEKKKAHCHSEEHRSTVGSARESTTNVTSGTDHEGGDADVKRKRKRRKRRTTQDEPRKFVAEQFANAAKYQKLVRKILKLQQSKAQYLIQHHIVLEIRANKCTEWSELHVTYMNRLLDEIRFHSEFAVDSNTGKRMSKHETEEYCAEISRIHHKFCDTMLKMYKSRRGLEFTLKRLKESEVQEGEEIEILEFEQLKDENSTIKGKLEDRMKDVENIKSKISYAIQILAHIRSKMYNMTENIDDGEDQLVLINKEVYAAKAQTELANKELVQKRREERALVIDSGLLDNPLLLRDYEETTETVGNLKEAKKSLERKIIEGNRELEDMKDRTAELRNHYPLLFSQSTPNIPREYVDESDSACLVGRLDSHDGDTVTMTSSPLPFPGFRLSSRRLGSLFETILAQTTTTASPTLFLPTYSTTEFPSTTGLTTTFPTITTTMSMAVTEAVSLSTTTTTLPLTTDESAPLMLRDPSTTPFTPTTSPTIAATTQLITEATTTAAQFLADVSNNLFPAETSTSGMDPTGGDFMSSASDSGTSRKFSGEVDHIEGLRLILSISIAFFVFLVIVFVILFLMGKKMTCSCNCCSCPFTCIPRPPPSVDLEMANIGADRSKKKVKKDSENPFDDLINL